MNGRELAFCAHYAVSRSAKQAALAAGYSPTYAKNAALNLLPRQHIQEQLNYLSERQNETVALDAAVVINEFGAIAMTRPDELLKVEDGVWITKAPDELSERQRAAVKKISKRWVPTGETDENGVAIRRQEFSYEMHDKLAALYKLGDHFGIGGDAGKKAGNPFEEMDQDELDAISQLMEKAVDRRAIEGEVA